MKKFIVYYYTIETDLVTKSSDMLVEENNILEALIKAKQSIKQRSVILGIHELLDYFDPENYKNVNDEQETI